MRRTPDDISAEMAARKAGLVVVLPLLQEHVAEIRRLAKRTVDDIVEIGRRLTECKKLVGHGKWADWVGREFGWSEDSALNVMRVFTMSESRKFRDLNIGISTLYLLAAPSTPEAAREEIFAQATSTPVSVADAKSVINKHKAKQKTSSSRDSHTRAPQSPSKRQQAAIEIEEAQLDNVCANADFAGRIEQIKPDTLADGFDLNDAIVTLIEASKRFEHFIDGLPPDEEYAPEDLNRIIVRLGDLRREMACRPEHVIATATPDHSHIAAAPPTTMPAKPLAGDDPGPLPVHQYDRIERLAGPGNVFVELFARGSGPPAHWHAAGDELALDATPTTVSENSTPTYDAEADVWRGASEAYVEIRERMRRGSSGWKP
jgi:hypothetical protein